METLTVEKALQLAEQAKSLKTDKDLLQFAKDNRGYIIVVLDNDASWLKFKYPENVSEEIDEILGDIELPDFEDDFGNRYGVNGLLDFAGIEAEDC